MMMQRFCHVDGDDLPKPVGVKMNDMSDYIAMPYTIELIREDATTEDSRVIPEPTSWKH